METVDESGPPRLHTLRSPGGDLVAVGAKIQNPPWTVIIEQPRTEALAVALRLERQLTAAISIALLATVVAGSWWGRSFIRRIFALTTNEPCQVASRRWRTPIEPPRLHTAASVKAMARSLIWNRIYTATIR